MNEREYIIELYEIYKELLTNKQKEYFEYYYYEDLSLSEIKENINVSRTIINKTVKVVEEKLVYYENKLNIYGKNKELKNIINNIKDKKLKEELEKLI